MTDKQLERIKKLGLKSSDFSKGKTAEERIAELERIIEEQDEALMELAEILVGGED